MSSPNSGRACKISFSVTRKETTKVVVQNKLLDKRSGDGEEEEESEQTSRKRGILSLEGGIIVDPDTPRKKEKKVFVIPVLQVSSQVQIERLSKLLAEDQATEQDKARLALLLESVGGHEHLQQQGAEETHDEQKASTKSLEALHQAPTVAVPDDADPDYESVPVGEFGLAFLRGCGWKDERTAIGKTNAQVVPLRVTAPRPKGLGLGAALPSAAPPPKPGTTAESDSRQQLDGRIPKKEAEDELKPLGKNSYVKCQGGLNKGAYGKVTSMDEENSSVFVELGWPLGKAGKTVRISQFAVEVIPPRELGDKLRQAATDNSPAAVENGNRTKRVRVK